MKSILLLLASLVCLHSLARADEGPEESPDLQTRIVDYAAEYRVDADGSYTESRQTALKVLKEPAIKRAKRASITYSTSIQKAEVQTAYNLKADGRRLEVPPSNFQVEINTGKEKGGPVFSDMTTMTVVFPDVEVGDTLVFGYRLTTSEAMFAGHFSARESFARTRAYDRARLRIDAPAELWAQYRTRQLTETMNTVEDGRRILEWTYANPEPAASHRYDYSVYDLESDPGLEFSTFGSHADIAAAYGSRARPKAAVTPRIQALADQIAGNAGTPREVAKALYDWVATHITYAGNCIGLGAVVPHDLDFVLDNRMGDCKDHATLLQALLAAKGIAATQALVNSGSAYRLPRVPLVAMVNHVINYLPELDLFLDSTSNTTPFGLLPYEDSDKPVLLVDGHRDGLKTPPLAVGSNWQYSRSTVTILPDGSAKGRVEIAQSGMYAAETRAKFRAMRKEVQDDLVKNLYKSMGYIGTGRVEADDPAPLSDSFRYQADFEVQGLYQLPGPGAFAIAPHFYSDAPISAYVSSAMQHDEEAPEWACTSGRTVEDYAFILPRNMKLLALPENTRFKSDFLSYEASYRRQGNRLLVRRMIDDRTPGNVCTAAMAKTYRDFAGKVLANLKAQVLYK